MRRRWCGAELVAGGHGKREANPVRTRRANREGANRKPAASLNFSELRRRRHHPTSSDRNKAPSGCVGTPGSGGASKEKAPLAMDDETDLQAQIARCRRIASLMIDEGLRCALEDLAVEYEARLAKRGKPFMLRGNRRGGD
jgi:hypothetical protein